MKYKIPFYGAVYLKEGYHDHRGRWIRGMVGTIELIDQKDLGISRAGDASWALRISHPDRSNRACVIPGCQIRTVRVFEWRIPADKIAPDFESFEKE